jgi:hypothetical protein
MGSGNCSVTDLKIRQYLKCELIFSLALFVPMPAVTYVDASLSSDLEYFYCQSSVSFCMSSTYSINHATHLSTKGWH